MAKAYNRAADLPSGCELINLWNKRRICIFIGWCEWDEDGDPTQGEYRISRGIGEHTAKTSYWWFQGLLDAGAMVAV